MSRKSIFFLAVIIVFLYFTIILFMLSPLQGAKHTYGIQYMSRFGYRPVPTVKWCKELQWKTTAKSSSVALYSFPGSGNTWLRYLLQQATGLLTGSIYLDEGLRLHGFPAENVTDGSVLVVKTHEKPPKNKMFNSAIILIRNPGDAILADFNRRHKGHIGTASRSAFKKKSHPSQKLDWNTFVQEQLIIWESTYRAWFTEFSGPIYILFYETLVRHTRRTLTGVLEFLNQTVSEEDMNCVLGNREGIYRRRNKIQFDPFTPEMHRELRATKSRLLFMITEYQRRQNYTDYDSEKYLLRDLRRPRSEGSSI